MRTALWSMMLCAAAICFALAGPATAANAEFRAFLQSLRPEALKAGVTAATFDTALAGLEPDLSLTDLELPGRPSTAPGQAEFTRAPSEYLDRAYMARLAEHGRGLAASHQALLARIEKEIGVERGPLLAIWGRVLATQAWVGRRKEQFRAELIGALRMLQDGFPRSVMRASWAGAMGMTQFLPSEFYQYGTDFDDDGRADIFHSVPDALASAAKQLKGKGWVTGQPWGFEVRLPANADCALEGPTQERPLKDWMAMGFSRARGAGFPAAQLGDTAYLMMPAGAYGPAFLVFENYKVIRRYNTSDLYAVFVGHLADRIMGGGDFEAPWGGVAAQKTKVVEEIQTRLRALGQDVEKIDGKVGSNTRKVIGTYQRASHLKVDCWPTDGLLAHLRSLAVR
jgi:lytic murein transglycosylase